MADIEKVIKGISQCWLPSDEDEYETQCHDCPYYEPGITLKECMSALRSDAIELLKKQQEEIDFLTVESGSNAELAEGYAELMKWQKGQFDTLKENFAHLSAMIAVQQDIVRCKDCKYGEPWGVLIGCGTTKGFGITHKPDWFCADGERKEGR